VIRHTSRAIVAVHKFLMATLNELCVDETVREQIWSLLLRDRLNTAYERAMAHARFLLEVERDQIPVTVDDSFEDNLRGHRSKRLEMSLDPNGFRLKDVPSSHTITLGKEALISAVDDRCDVDKEIHDVLRSYYSVALGRIIDSVCQQVVYHFLLHGKGSPLSIFCPELIMSLSDVQLAAIASEDAVIQEKRERLGREIDKLRKAVEELRFVA
jgi:dynamin GTPase effector domain-containing protein